MLRNTFINQISPKVHYQFSNTTSQKMIATAQRKFLEAKIASLEKQRKEAVRNKVQPTNKNNASKTDPGDKTMKIHRDLDKTQEQLKKGFYIFSKNKFSSYFSRVRDIGSRK